jgi:DNA-binding XRE family transcriptional regulator
MARKKTSADTLKILDEMFFQTEDAQHELRAAETSAEISRQVYALRMDAGLTQNELASLAGTSHSVISRVEDDDYEGHSLNLLRRIAESLNRKIEIRFISITNEE